MTHKRNTLGLAAAAKKRRQDTIKRVNDAIRLLVKEKRVVNFNSVAKAANVGKTWLYKEIDIRENILKYRENISGFKKLSTSHEKASSSSKDGLIQMLRSHIKEIEAENRELKKQIEVLYGQLSQ